MIVGDRMLTGQQRFERQRFGDVADAVPTMFAARHGDGEPAGEVGRARRVARFGCSFDRCAAAADEAQRSHW